MLSVIATKMQFFRLPCKKTSYFYPVFLSWLYTSIPNLSEHCECQERGCIVLIH